MPLNLGVKLSAPSASAFPGSPVEGQLHYDNTVERLYWYDGTAWRGMQDGPRRYVQDITPEEIGFKAWSFDPIYATLNVALPAGQIVFARVPIPETITLANLHVYVDVAGATLTAGQSFGLVYSKTGTLLGRTADQASAWVSTGEKTMALTAEAGQSLAITGSPTQWVLAAAYSVGTTRPAFPRWDAARIMTTGNKGLTGNNIRYGVANSGLTSTPPATLASQASSSNYFWFGLS